MTYLELYKQADYELEHSLITLGEYEKRIKPLEEEVRQTGHWIEMNTNPDGTHNIYCSNCNIYQKFKGHANSYNARTKLKYCPNCGVKMEGE